MGSNVPCPLEPVYTGLNGWNQLEPVYTGSNVPRSVRARISPLLRHPVTPLRITQRGLHSVIGLFSLITQTGNYVWSIWYWQSDIVNANSLLILTSKSISLRRANAEESVSGGQGVVRCNCKKKRPCDNDQCKCRKMKRMCTSKCHSSGPCNNKWQKRSRFALNWTEELC